jgi:enhancing lycopene biosynthesis protein 2
MAKVAVVLSGAGYLDGSEIHESVLCLLMLSKYKHQYHCFAPDKEQRKLMNHLTKQEIKTEKRNCLLEAARIARGKIAPLASLEEKAFDALLLPGGMGAVMNLCDFAEKGVKCSIDPQLKDHIISFYQAKKPIGATCIAPILIAKALEGIASVEMTLGRDPQYQSILQQMGMKGTLAHVKECVQDKQHRIYTTPCYMEPEDLAGMSEGVEALVKHFI